MGVTEKVIGIIVFTFFFWMIITEGNIFLKDDSDKQDDTW